MDEQQLLALKPELDRFLDRFAPLFGRRWESGACTPLRSRTASRRRTTQRREHCRSHESAGPCDRCKRSSPPASGRIARSSTEMRCGVLEVLGDEDAVWNSDETGFPKKGTKSVGVKRQYSGTLGRTDNCQVAVFANYCSTKGHTFMDRRLFLPQEWASDR